MIVYAGIDEAGYGPLFGPLVIGRAALGLPDHFKAVPDGDDAAADCLWKHLDDAVCRTLSKRRGRIAVNDSKKLHTQASGITHLERAVLAFSGQKQDVPATVDVWLDALGETTHQNLNELPWYAPSDEHPWQDLPQRCTSGEVAVARSMLSAAMKRCGLELLDMAGAVVFEDRFNQMVEATRSKATTAFTFVSAHLKHLWDRYGSQDPTVIVDRQSARMHYRQPLALAIPKAQIRILEETQQVSAYHLSSNDRHKRSMTVRFEVEADSRHMPVALASMVAKYTREILMARFQDWFSEQVPQIKPTAGYGSDGKRFWEQIEPQLAELSVAPGQLRRAR